MNLKGISRKIQHTKLFSDAHKVELLAMLPEATKKDIDKLIKGIDAFDREYARTIKTHTQEMSKLLTDMFKHMSHEEKEKYRDAVDELSMGLAILQPAS